jgi:hypothetical protein
MEFRFVTRVANSFVRQKLADLTNDLRGDHAVALFPTRGAFEGAANGFAYCMRFEMVTLELAFACSAVQQRGFQIKGSNEN